MSFIRLRRRRTLKLLLVAACAFLGLHVLLVGFKSPGAYDVKRFMSKHANKKSPVYHEDKLGNFEPVNPETIAGPGEDGKAYIVPFEKKSDAEISMKKNGINLVASEDISLDRTVKDTRLDECKHWEYPEDLPRTSVIIAFHNEGWTTLLRTVHSIVNRSPPHILEEVLLVDDFSDKDYLKEPLEEYMRKYSSKVRIVRNKEREGLIRTKNNGAMKAVGEVILFLDSHCEVNTNWLPPLLAPIYENRTTMTVPIVDGIDHDTFEYRIAYHSKDINFMGIFEWGMYYKETKVPLRETQKHKYMSEPYDAPNHAGGLFAIDRNYFLELGAYDPGLLLWGGENFELSFKIWQCGGRQQWVPCSRVGHIYRPATYGIGKLAEKKKGPLAVINYKRVIETWYDDEHKEYFYTREPLARFYDMGDISEQIALKNRLKCKSFSWFMREVGYEILNQYPYPPPNAHWGEFINTATETCLDTMSQPPGGYIGLSGCHHQGGNQLMKFNVKGQLTVGERCIDATSQGVKLIVCPMGTVHGPWIYDENERTMKHNRLDMCMAAHPQNKQLMVLSCNSNNNYHKWTFKEIRPRL